MSVASLSTSSALLVKSKLVWLQRAFKWTVFTLSRLQSLDFFGLHTRNGARHVLECVAYPVADQPRISHRALACQSVGSFEILSLISSLLAFDNSKKHIVWYDMVSGPLE